MTRPDEHAPPSHTAEFRFYAELNDFLAPGLRGHAFDWAFRDRPSVRDTIQAIGVPHTEVDLVLVDGRSVDFGHRLAGGERVAVYPVFERLDISRAVRLRPAPLRTSRFILDVHLGKLARFLRMLGFDTRWDRDRADAEIIDIALEEARIILTRDLGILKQRRVTHGYWLRSTDAERQLLETVTALDLWTQFRPFTRCMQCNGPVEDVGRNTVSGVVPKRILERHALFRRCRGCGKIYWRGTHHRRMAALIAWLEGHGPR